MFLSTFFPEPVPKTEDEYFHRKLSKNDVHYSKYNGLFPMLWHDFLHRGQIVANLSNYIKREFKVSLRNYLQPIFDCAKTTAQENEKRLLYTGLFYLIHELNSIDIPDFSYILQNPPDDLSDSLKTELDRFREISNKSQQEGFLANSLLLEFLIYHINNRQQEAINKLAKDPYNSYAYKSQYRDYEYMLIHAKGLDGKQFIPLIALNEKTQNFLPLAENKKGECAVVVSPCQGEDAFDAFCFETKEQIKIPYRISEGNILLNSWTWLDKNSRKMTNGIFLRGEERDAANKANSRYYWRKDENGFEIIVCPQPNLVLALWAWIL